jgi:hypothetical protein
MARTPVPPRLAAGPVSAPARAIIGGTVRRSRTELKSAGNSGRAAGAQRVRIPDQVALSELVDGDVSRYALIAGALLGSVPLALFLCVLRRSPRSRA